MRGREIALDQFGVEKGNALALQPCAYWARISAGTGGTAARPDVSALK